MSTRSNIGILHANGSVTAIYCHFDGYTSHHGPILLTAYNTLEKVKELVALGSISSLDTNASTPPVGHSYDNPVEGFVVAYGRDRGEEDTEAVVYGNIVDMMDAGEEFVYLFSEKSGQWSYSDHGGDWKHLVSDPDVKLWLKQQKIEAEPVKSKEEVLLARKARLVKSLAKVEAELRALRS